VRVAFHRWAATHPIVVQRASESETANLQQQYRTYVAGMGEAHRAAKECFASRLAVSAHGEMEREEAQQRADERGRRAVERIREHRRAVQAAKQARVTALQQARDYPPPPQPASGEPSSAADSKRTAQPANAIHAYTNTFFHLMPPPPRAVTAALAAAEAATSTALTDDVVVNALEV
jgi:hypothetical protein